MAFHNGEATASVTRTTNGKLRSSVILLATHHSKQHVAKCARFHIFPMFHLDTGDDFQVEGRS